MSFFLMMLALVCAWGQGRRDRCYPSATHITGSGFSCLASSQRSSAFPRARAERLTEEGFSPPQAAAFQGER